ncbi:MAG: sugar phosphate nucleotidyltransferase [Myxococcota bacterium]
MSEHDGPAELAGAASRRRRTHAIILAGGAGERFWPASRKARPKPFLRAVGGRTLLDATLTRARRVAGRDQVWVVCAQEHVSAVRRASGLPGARILAEPERRNTAMAVGLAAVRVAREDPDALQVVLPADHVIPDTRAFAAEVGRSLDAADRAQVLVTLGVRPTHPDPGYGYILTGRPAGRGFPGLRQVRRFVEKPSEVRARRYLRQGGALWNAGIFVWRVDVLLEELERHAPRLSRNLAPLRGVGARGWKQALVRAYRGAPGLPIDVAVVEQSRRVWSRPVSFRWSDVGTWESLARELGVGGDVSRVIEGEVLSDDARGNLVWARDRFVALLGVEGLAIVDTGDALLVTRLDRSPEVRRIVRALRRRGRAELL